MNLNDEEAISMSFFAYILLCADGSYYVGHTDNLEKRLSEHKSKIFSCYTSNRLPIKLVWHQAFASRDAAFVVERRIKGWKRAKKEALINGDWNLLSQLASRRKPKPLMPFETPVFAPTELRRGSSG